MDLIIYWFIYGLNNIYVICIASNNERYKEKCGN